MADSPAAAQSFRRPPTAQEAVLDELRREVATGRLRPGEQVVQEEVAARLGVSRVPVREALKILEGEGQVTYHPHRGYFVAQLSVEDLVEVYRIRALLEREAIAVGVHRVTAEQRQQIDHHRKECEVAAAADDLPAMVAANRSFHFALYDASGMPRLVRMIRLCWDATDVYRNVYYADEHHRASVVREHRRIARAFSRGDADGAVRLLDEHREHAVVAVANLLAEDLQ